MNLLQRIERHLPWSRPRDGDAREAEVVRYDVHRVVDEWFDRAPAGMPFAWDPFEPWRSAPAIQQHDDEYVVRVDAPGLDPKELSVEAADGVLSVRGERRSDDGNGAPLLPASAELKMIRLHQLRVNDVTRQFHLERTPEGELSDEQRQAVRHIAEKQGRVAELTRELHERLNKER